MKRIHPFAFDQSTQKRNLWNLVNSNVLNSVFVVVVIVQLMEA